MLHHAHFLARGYSEFVAEELTARTHELYALRRSLPSVSGAIGTLVVWDNALIDAKADLESHSDEDRTATQRAELRRIRLQRTLLTSPHARIVYLLGLGLGATCLMTAGVERIVGR